jgi:hypothetical protein
MRRIPTPFSPRQDDGGEGRGTSGGGWRRRR